MTILDTGLIEAGKYDRGMPGTAADFIDSKKCESDVNWGGGCRSAHEKRCVPGDNRTPSKPTAVAET